MSELWVYGSDVCFTVKMKSLPHWWSSCPLQNMSSQKWYEYISLALLQSAFLFRLKLHLCFEKKRQKMRAVETFGVKTEIGFEFETNYSMSGGYSLVDFHDYCTTSAHKRSFGHTWSADRLFWFWKLYWVSDCGEICLHKNLILKLPVYNFNSLSTGEIAWLEKSP